MNPQTLLYAKTHEWVSLADEGGGKVATVGISAFAVEALTDLVFMELPQVGRQVKPQESICEIESVKAVSDLYSPVEGEVIAVNETLPDNLETLSEDPFGAGWVCKIKLSSDVGLSDLMDHAAYQKVCAKKRTSKVGSPTGEVRVDLHPQASPHPPSDSPLPTPPFRLPPSPMPYLYNTPDDQAAMLAAIGAESIDELFKSIPAELKIGRPLDIPCALGELELEQHLRELAGKNLHASSAVSFLGGGSYDHFVPAAVDTIGSRSEFYTSYTPYQAEVAQGNLQAMFEYQSLITRLTGLEVSNSSLYDGGSATAEAVLMAVDVTKRRGRVVLAASLHPEYRQTIATYLANLGVEVVTVGAPEGTVDIAELATEVDDQTACVVLQHPNFFGCLEDAEAVAQVAHDAGALVVAVFDPISLGLLKRPGDWGADIAVAEGQSLGTPMSYGGPVLGILACSESSCAECPAASWAKRSTVAATSASCSPCKPASSTSAAKSPRATSAPTRRSSPCGPRCTCRSLAPAVCATWPTCACRRAATWPISSTARAGSNWYSPLRHSRSS